jgi:NTE family protein
MGSKHIDVVMEGGGVKGIGLVGALEVLAHEGYHFRRVAGTSAGAIVGSLLAAGVKPKQIHQAISQLDFTDFQDESFIDRLGPFGKGLSIIFEKGIYEGKFLTTWLGDQLASAGVKTFADLKLTGKHAKDLPENQRYKLVVLVSDVTRGRLIRLPWDYHEYGLDPDQQLVADAVHASSAMPFYYEPVKLQSNLLVDGGLISNFPVWLFEPSKHKHNIDIPTIGLKLSAREEALGLRPESMTSSTLGFGFSILSTLTSALDQIHLDDPCTQRRTVFIDTFDLHSTDFGITPEQQVQLYQNGRSAAEKFLKDWNLTKFIKQCPGD